RDLALDAPRRAHDQAVVRNLLAFRDQRVGANDAIAPDARAVEDDGLDADQAVVADGATMQHGLVAHSHASADARREAGIGMHHAAVLDIRACADEQVFDVAAQHGIEPDADFFAERYPAEHGGVGGD